ncbi:hypothetical protein LUZ61_002420 [Rhynchospora tenuis]|uniref:Xyloglucan endotransglucosylase/hydrolase n=1 Tax=Rhynchospora tenuis TaxID=198213 RepID=A0AAD5ZIY8_9POAL|nr:hypothetical protein LUZ61_002420 [Rhynchospora tenuis]
MEFSIGAFVLYVVSVSSLICFTNADNFYKDVDITWGNGRGKILENGNLISLSLDWSSGSGFQSKKEYLFAKVDMQIKLVPGNSAGTVTTFYLRSMQPKHDEIDLEFLGNVSGSPYTLHTNLFTQAVGNREMQFNLWFDPTRDFHNYTILWSAHHVIILVDGIPIRDFKNHEKKGVLFPTSQPLRMYASLWDGDSWATQGGRVKTDWSKAPFVAMYRNHKVDACNWSGGKPNCHKKPWWNYEVTGNRYKQMRWVQRKFMIYNYCDDVKRFPQGLPLECKLR